MIVGDSLETVSLLGFEEPRRRMVHRGRPNVCSDVLDDDLEVQLTGEDEAQGVQEPEGLRRVAILDVEGEHGAIAALGEESPGRLVLGVAREPGIADARDRRVALEEARDAERALALTRHPKGKRLEPAKGEPGLVRAERGPHLDQHVGQPVVVLETASHRAGEDVPVAGQELADAVRDEIGAQRRRAEEVRRSWQQW